MVSGSVRNAAPDLGLQLFVSMLGNGLCPNEFALASALGACCQSAVANARLGLSVHGLAVKAGLDANPYVGSSLMLMYASMGVLLLWSTCLQALFSETWHARM